MIKFTFIKYFIGMVFLLSAFSKLIDFPATVAFFVNLSGMVFKWVSIGLVLMIIIELSLAVAIVYSRQNIQLVYSATLVLFVTFSVFSTLLIFSDAENCGCFGTLIKSDPLLTILKNIVLIWLVHFLKRQERIVACVR